MKYRILEKRTVITKGNAPLSEFIPQKKYSFWPFWMNVIHRHYSDWSLEAAQECIDRYEQGKIKYPVIIHEYPVKNVLDKAEEHSKMYPGF